MLENPEEIREYLNGEMCIRDRVYDNQVKCNAEILRMGEKLGIKVIATNDVHFLNAEDAEAHDLLICLNTRKDLDRCV